MRGVLFLAVLAAGCASGNGVAPEEPRGGGSGGSRIERHETYIRNPTRVDGDAVLVILPVGYRENVAVQGLSEGWREEGGLTTWTGAGICLLELDRLGIRARRSLKVTLKDGQEEPEVTIQASGNVSMLHSVRGVGSSVNGADFLLLVNDRSLEH